MPVVRDHPVAAPPGTDIKIWRYLDLSKLVSLLTSSQLWFARADLLGDPLEGSVGRAQHALRAEVYAGWAPDHLASMTPQLSEARRLFVRRTFINCWHANEGENVAMWRAYAGIGQALAIRSSSEGLCRALNAVEESVFVTPVFYVDHDVQFIPENDTKWPFLCKRDDFAYEREIRAMIQFFDDGHAKHPGLAVQVDLPELVEAIVVGPYQPQWFVDAVRDCASAFLPGVPVETSSLQRLPIY